MGVALVAVFVAAAGSARGQEAIPAFPDIAAAGGPGAIVGVPRIPDAQPLASPPGHGAASSEEPDAAPPGEAPAAREVTHGSRLLRALTEPTAQAGRETERAVPAFVAGDCPRALLRRLLAGVAGEADALAALAIEREILTLCSERQRIVTALFETEARLRELRAPAEPVPAVEAAGITPPTPSTSPAPAAAVVVRETPAMPAPDPAPSTLRRALAVDTGGEAEPSLGWFSIVGSAGALRAGITDGTGVWFVREGDALPGGGEVTAIAGRPPSVRATAPDEAAAEPLPFRPRPGGAG